MNRVLVTSMVTRDASHGEEPGEGQEPPLDVDRHVLAFEQQEDVSARTRDASSTALVVPLPAAAGACCEQRLKEMAMACCCAMIRSTYKDAYVE